MIAERTALLTVFYEGTLEALFPDHFNDLYQIQSLYAWKPQAFKVDTEGVLFHTLGPRSPELMAKNNRLENRQGSFVCPRSEQLGPVEGGAVDCGVTLIAEL